MAACAATGGRDELPEAVAVGELTAVYFGTDRNRRDVSNPEKFYGEKRGVYEHGIALVSGAQREAKTQLTSVEPLQGEDFLQQLQLAVQQAPEPTVLIFVHGYLRSFRKASKLVAEFSVNTNFQGVPVLWSWPSTSNPAGYTIDETNEKWSRTHFARFIRDIVEESGAQTVHLVGHSLGARSLSRVFMYDIRVRELDLESIGEVVLLAPDIDRDIFRRDIAPALAAADLSVTLYTSANDNALATAQTVHGNPRAGDSSQGALVVPGVETIDVTSANHSVLGHSYFRHSEMVSEDISRLLHSRDSADQRENLIMVPGRDGTYWSLEVVQ